MLYLIYQFLTGFSAPVLDALLQRRLKQGKEDPARLNERKGESAIKRPSGKLIWVHAASIGEAMSALPLLDELKERLPEWNFLMTTGTVTSAQLMAQRLPPGIVHQYIPMDHPAWVKKFFDHWQPNAVLWMESELWPNILHEIAVRKIPAALLNARMSPDSQKKWKYAQSLTRKMLATFNFILAGAQDYVDAYKRLGAKKVYYIGNLKFGARQLPVDLDRFSELKDMIGARRCIGFLQTQPGEDKMAAEIFIELKKTMPDLLMILVPRKNTRGSEIKSQMKMIGLVPAVRTLREPITSETDVYIADTIGEMGIWYSLCPVAVIGGSFVPHGGQNPIEGTHFGAAVFYGPHMFNFPEITAVMEVAEAAERVETPNDLLTVIQKTFRYPAVMDVKQEKARNLARQNKHIIQAYADEIIERLVP
jgi:3-deoxy-D-manno-octulosonic-acid transferase